MLSSTIPDIQDFVFVHRFRRRDCLDDLLPPREFVAIGVASPDAPAATPRPSCLGRHPPPESLSPGPQRKLRQPKVWRSGLQALSLRICVACGSAKPVPTPLLCHPL